ncbi:hypothetical protein VNO77_43491 [Canavalia gladiata]|uniref:Uncharacterized protein n=1 Tax=Canavalia gladiata TaxID=3824 RepID=A0AAN9PMY9_CANGL
MEKKERCLSLTIEMKNSMMFLVGGDARSVESSNSFNNKGNGHQGFSSSDVLNASAINNGPAETEDPLMAIMEVQATKFYRKKRTTK